MKEQVVQEKTVEVIKEVIKEVERPRPAMNDACVGTDPMVVEQKPKSTPSQQQREAPKKAAPPPPEEDGASDVLSTMLGILFSGIFGLIWLVLVRIPLKIFSFTLLVTATGALLSIVWLYLADDHGAARMGAGLGYGFNSPGIV